MSNPIKLRAWRSWWQSDWRKDPLIQQSDNPMLRELAVKLVKSFSRQGETVARIASGLGGCGSPHHDIEASSRVMIGTYLIPGEYCLKLKPLEIGAMLEYWDGRVEWNVFSLQDIYDECKGKPVQLRMF